MSKSKRRAERRRIETWDDLYANPEDRPAAQGCQVWAEMLETPHARSPRDMVITVVARLEVALTELLQLRLVDDREAQESFLGIYTDAEKAPAGDLGAKISLAYLIGVLPKGMALTFHCLRRLRNLMAHRVNIGLLDPRAQKEVRVLREACLEDGPRKNAASTGSTEGTTLESPDCTELATEDPRQRIISGIDGLYDDAVASDKDESAAARVVWFQASTLEFWLRLIRAHEIERLKEWDESEHEHGNRPDNVPVRAQAKSE